MHAHHVPKSRTLEFRLGTCDTAVRRDVADGWTWQPTHTPTQHTHQHELSDRGKTWNEQKTIVHTPKHTQTQTRAYHTRSYTFHAVTWHVQYVVSDKSAYTRNETHAQSVHTNTQTHAQRRLTGRRPANMFREQRDTRAHKLIKLINYSLGRALARVLMQLNVWHTTHG